MHGEKMNDTRQLSPELKVLAAMGLGLDAVLMSEPRLFVDRNLLATLLAELEDELDPEDVRAALFQVGLLHGLRDVARCVDERFADEGKSSAPWSPPLAIRLGRHSNEADGSGQAVRGSWPEAYEAEARVAKLGPEDEASCWLSSGYTSGWLSGSFGIDLVALEHQCSCRGDQSCEFVAREPAAWQARGDARLALLMGGLSHEHFRQLARGEREQPGERPDVEFSERVEPEESAVHIWGPVMVLPAQDLEAAMGTVDVLSKDPACAEIRVVVLDLGGAGIDEGMGAATLEQILDCIEGWGAEAIVTGVASFAEEAVIGLEQAPLIVRKGLPEAIARAFQIADLQRQAV